MSNSAAGKCTTVDWRLFNDSGSDIEDDMDNELPLSSIADFLLPIEKCLLRKSKIIHYQTKRNIIQKYIVSCPSISEAIQPPIHFDIVKNGSHKYDTFDYLEEANKDQDNKLTISSIDNKFIKCETVNCQSKVLVSDPNRKIFKNQQSTINIQTRKYKCDICGHIFSKRIHIIKHFKISYCFPG